MVHVLWYVCLMPEGSLTYQRSQCCKANREKESLLDERRLGLASSIANEDDEGDPAVVEDSLWCMSSVEKNDCLRGMLYPAEINRFDDPFLLRALVVGWGREGTETDFVFF